MTGEEWRSSFRSWIFSGLQVLHPEGFSLIQPPLPVTFSSGQWDVVRSTDLQCDAVGWASLSCNGSLALNKISSILQVLCLTWTLLVEAEGLLLQFFIYPSLSPPQCGYTKNHSVTFFHRLSECRCGFTASVLGKHWFKHRRLLQAVTYC